MSAPTPAQDGEFELASASVRPEPSDVEALLRELAEAKAVIAEANNSLFGSQGYFLSLNGGPADKYHLSRAIESLKADTRQNHQMAEALRPLARLKVPWKPSGNAGAYSILFDDIRRAQSVLENCSASLADATQNKGPSHV